MPKNAHQLAQELKLDYKTVRYHLAVLEKHYMVEKAGTGYGAVYFISKSFRKALALCNTSKLPARELKAQTDLLITTFAK